VWETKVQAGGANKSGVSSARGVGGRFSWSRSGSDSSAEREGIYEKEDEVLGIEGVRRDGTTGSESGVWMWYEGDETPDVGVEGVSSGC
jgi:hypothetical protein